jgi:hypothetical protein
MLQTRARQGTPFRLFAKCGHVYVPATSPNVGPAADDNESDSSKTISLGGQHQPGRSRQAAEQDDTCGGASQSSLIIVPVPFPNQTKAHDIRDSARGRPGVWFHAQYAHPRLQRRGPISAGGGLHFGCGADVVMVRCGGQHLITMRLSLFPLGSSPPAPRGACSPHSHQPLSARAPDGDHRPFLGRP